MSIRDFSKYGVGQGLHVNNLGGNYDDGFALIMEVLNTGVKIVPVKYVVNENVLFDRSDRPIDQDNVPLKDCPPPFTNDSDWDAYAVADVSHAGYLAFAEFDKYDVHTSDDYQCISDRDMALVLDHDKTQYQKEFTRMAMLRELPVFDITIDGEDDGYDFE